ncbi:hypothetical protein K1719_028018 [Acacia pycnantha]|nr:hypothetical protein K1719_028018 [Acacia pycnantha]
MSVRHVRLWCGPLELAEEIHYVDEVSPVLKYSEFYHAFQEVEVVYRYMTTQLITTKRRPVYVGSYHWNSRTHFSFKCIYGLLRREGFFSHEWDATHNSAYSGLDQSYLPQGNADEEEDAEHVITEGHNHRDRRRSEDTLYQ